MEKSRGFGLHGEKYSLKMLIYLEGPKMNWRRWVFILTMSISMGVWSTGEAAAQIPLRDFFRNPELSALELSPDGKQVAFLAPVERRLNLFVQGVNEEKPRQVTDVRDRDIGGYFWKNGATLIYLKDDGGDENYHLFAVDIVSGQTRDLTPFPGVRAGIVDDLEDLEDEVLIDMNQRRLDVFDVYRLNVKTGAMTMVAENPGNYVGYLTDHEGKVRVALAKDADQNQNILLYRDNEQQEFRPIITTGFKDQVSPYFFSADNRQLYATSNIGRDRKALVLIDPATGKEVQTLFAHPEVDVGGAGWSRLRKVLTSVGYTTDKSHRHFFDDKIRKIYATLQKQLPGYEVALTSIDKAEEQFVVRTYSDKSRGAYYLFNAKTGALKKWRELSPWLNEQEMAEMRPVSYKSRDGLTIHGYLTLPKGKEAKNLPVIVNPHGGPWVRDSWGFNSEVQLLANRGYAVLQMNYRGSTGYGRTFWEAGFKQWGRKMQDDITDGVEWLIKQGIADPKRVAIYGGSYGGYAVLAGLAFTPEVYACGIDYVGVSNIFTLMKTIPPYWKPLLAEFYEKVGHPEKDEELLRSVSPVFHADKIKAPLFIVQGARDPRVNKAESDQMVAALAARGIKVEYMVKDNEGHGFRNEENRFEFYEAMEKFLQGCLQ